MHVHPCLSNVIQHPSRTNLSNSNAQGPPPPPPTIGLDGTPIAPPPQPPVAPTAAAIHSARLLAEAMRDRHGAALAGWAGAAASVAAAATAFSASADVIASKTGAVSLRRRSCCGVYFSFAGRAHVLHTRAMG